jgi:hypothetical protein
MITYSMIALVFLIILICLTCMLCLMQVNIMEEVKGRKSVSLGVASFNFDGKRIFTHDTTVTVY